MKESEQSKAGPSQIELVKEQSQFEMIEAWDENQITEEMKGKIIEEYFYEFDVGGKKVVGISFSGTKHVGRKMAELGQPIVIQKVVIEETPDEFIAEAHAVNNKTGFGMIGLAVQPKMMTLRDKSKKPDSFARVKAHSKAQRNAIRNHIPETAIKEGYKEWRELKGGKQNNLPSPSKPPAAPAQKPAASAPQKIEYSKEEMKGDITDYSFSTFPVRK